MTPLKETLAAPCLRRRARWSPEIGVHGDRYETVTPNMATIGGAAK